MKKVFLDTNLFIRYVVSVCGHANEHYPLFTGNAKVIHVGVPEPPKLAVNAKTEKEALNYYRRVCDEIKTFVEQLPKALTRLSE